MLYTSDPPGPLSNDINQDTFVAPAIAIVSIFLAITTIVVVLRMICRLFVLKGTGLDDWCSVLALLSSTTIIGCFFYLLDQRLLRPPPKNGNPSDFLGKRLTGPLLIIQIVSNLANFSAKMSILLFLRRLFPYDVSPKTAIAIWFGIFTNVVAYLTLTVIVIAVCGPQVGAPRLGPNMCPGPLQIRLGQGTGALNAVLDLYALAVAVPSLWMLRMPTRRKISVIAILALGLCACGFSFAVLAIRVHSKAAEETPKKEASQIVFSILEPLLATITACLPTLPALWREVVTNTFLKTLFSKGSSLSRVCNTNKTTTKGSQHRLGDAHSLTSLEPHRVRLAYDAEQNAAPISVKDDYIVTSASK